MLASALIEELKNLIAINGDLEMAIDDGFELRPLEEVDASADESEECFILYME